MLCLCHSACVFIFSICRNRNKKHILDNLKAKQKLNIIAVKRNKYYEKIMIIKCNLANFPGEIDLNLLFIIHYLVILTFLAQFMIQ